MGREAFEGQWVLQDGKRKMGERGAEGIRDNGWRHRGIMERK